MAKTIDKIVQQKTTPKDKNVLWDDGENLKINRKGKWESANNAEINNLSIDPVVWKYICNPLIIVNDQIVPNELLNNNGYLKYLNKGMYKVAYYLDGNEIIRDIMSMDNNMLQSEYVEDNQYFSVTIDNDPDVGIIWKVMLDA